MLRTVGVGFLDTEIISMLKYLNCVVENLNRTMDYGTQIILNISIKLRCS
jgi:hypothetical protein